MRPWKGQNAPEYPPAKPGFNGATTLRPWKVAGPRTRRPRRAASMGPRPCGRGRCGYTERTVPALALQWGHDLAAVEGRAGALHGCRGICFNGATTLRPWKVALAAAVAGPALASMGPRPCGRGRWQRPGMEPTDDIGLQWGHDLAAVEGVFTLYSDGFFPTSFNGATTLRPWKAVPAEDEDDGREASMGPRPCGRGRHAGRSPLKERV